MASRWLPNIEEFFNSYCRVLIDGGNLMNVEDDKADFFARRIDEHEQTVRTLAARLLEAVPLPSVSLSRCLNLLLSHHLTFSLWL